MTMMLRTIALAVVLGLIVPARLPAQAAPQPVPTPEPPSAVAPAAVPVRVQTKIAGNLQKLKALGMMTQSGPSADTSAVRVVPAGEIAVDTLAAVTEDMTVMRRIFQTTVEQAPATDYAFGVYGASDPFQTMFMGRGRQNGQTMYLQGFGALFTLDVDFPLSPGPQAEEEDPQEQADMGVDPVWRATRQQLFDPRSSDRREKSNDQGQVYSAEKVEKLKTDIIKALKHAANIRHLAPDEVVVVTVSGRPVLLPDDMIAATTVLTIRAKRSDIDSFAKGDSNLDQFRQKVQVISHRQLAGAEGHSATTPMSTGYRNR